MMRAGRDYLTKGSVADQCGRNARHPSREAALAALNDDHGAGNPAFNVYHCPHCSHWHVGHVRRQDPGASQ